MKTLATPATALLRIVWLSATFFSALLAPSMAEELAITNDVTAVIDNYGAIESITTRHEVVTGKGQLTARKNNQSPILYQGWGSVLNNKVQLESSNGASEAIGAMVAKEDPGLSQIEFKIRYKKESDSALSMHAEVTTLEESDWSEPPYFSLSLPLSQYTDATLVLEDAKGIERTYTVDSAPLSIRSYGTRRLTITKGKKKLVITASPDSQIGLLDGRTWKSAILRIDLTSRKPWQAVYHATGGKKELIDATLSFKDGE